MPAKGFQKDAIVLLTLNSPRQKFFGRLLSLNASGVELRGVPLESLEDLARQLRAHEPAGASTLFFPMHRVERMELDEAAGAVPALGVTFASQAGRTLQAVFGGGRRKAPR
jgi:hypothetical protein